MNYDGLTFKQWLRSIDDILSDVIGMTHADLRDRLWRDAFDAGLSPEEVIEEFYGSCTDEETIMEEELYG